LDRNQEDGRVLKCTLCYDRQKDGLTPACAKACPTASIKFGPVEQLHQIARQRVAELHDRGETDAYLYGDKPQGEYSTLNSFFLLKDNPSVYNLPEAPRRPHAHMKANYLISFATTIGLTALTALLMRRKEEV
jgi:formate dehydrogenase iron-sulfur subunit